jgi:hypothetical protein
MQDPVCVLLGIHSTTLDDAQADINDIMVVHRVACSADVRSADEEVHCKGSKSLEGCQVLAILCQFSLQSLVVVCLYFVMNQLKMYRKTVLSCFMWIGLYVSQITFGRFDRKTSERATFIVTLSPRVLWLRACVALRLLRSLSDVHVEKSGASSTSFGKGKSVEGCVLLVRYEYRSGDATRNSMFIVAEAGVLWLGTTAHVHHQVDKRCESRNSIDLCRCSGEGCFHAGDGGFCQGRHGE